MSEQKTERACWITMPWGMGHSWISGTDPDDIRARAEIERQREIDSLTRRIEAIRIMPLVIEYAEDDGDV